MAGPKDLTLLQGKTFTLVLRWETEPIVRKAITGVSFALGAPRITAVGHGAPDGWRCTLYGIKGPKQLNAANNPPRAEDYHTATVLDADTVELNEINPYDEQGNEWPAYVSGGFLQYNTPMDMTGYTARMDIKNKVGGTVLASTDSGDTPLDVIDITIDNTAKTITLSIAATDSDDFTWKSGVYDLEMVSSTGAVTALLTGKVFVTKEVTT